MSLRNRAKSLIALVLALAAASLTGLAAPALAAGAYTVSGTVVGVSPQGDPLPLEGVTVALWDSLSYPDDMPFGTITDASGHFSISGEESGSARLMAVIPVGPWVGDPSFDYQTNLVFNQLATSANGITVLGDPVTQQVDLSATTEVTGVQIGIPIATGFGTISGKITNQNSSALQTKQYAGQSLSLATVSALDSNGAVVSEQVINADGSYSMPVMPGNYFVSVGADSYSNVLTTFNGGVFDIEQATPISVAADANVSNVDIQANQLNLFDVITGIFSIKGEPFAGSTLAAGKFSTAPHQQAALSPISGGIIRVQALMANAPRHQSRGLTRAPISCWQVMLGKTCISK